MHLSFLKDLKIKSSFFLSPYQVAIIKLCFNYHGLKVLEKTIGQALLFQQEKDPDLLFIFQTGMPIAKEWLPTTESGEKRKAGIKTQKYSLQLLQPKLGPQNVMATV